MQMNRIIIGAFSGWQMADRRRRCLATWFPLAAASGVDAVFLMGVDRIPSPERHGDMLLLPCPNDYGTLPQRTRWFCRWALERSDWDYLFKCDDDTYIHIGRLSDYDTAGRDYIGGEWQPGVQYGSGGGGYWLSRRAAELVAEKLTAIRGAEDLLVGKLLRESGIPFHIDNRFVGYSNDRPVPRQDNDVITAHGINQDVFLRIHRDLYGPAEAAG